MHGPPPELLQVDEGIDLMRRQKNALNLFLRLGELGVLGLGLSLHRGLVEAVCIKGGALVHVGGRAFQLRPRLSRVPTGSLRGSSGSCVGAGGSCGGLLAALLGELVLVVQLGEKASLP